MVAIHTTSGNDVFSVGRWALNESENRVPSFARQPGNSYLLAMAVEPQVSNVGVRNEATFSHIRHDEPDARKQLTLVVLHLGDNPPRPRPTLRLIAKAFVAHEGFATGSPRRTKQDVFDLQLQVPVGRDADHEPLLVDRVPLLRPFTKSFLVGRPVVECCRIEVSSIGPDKRVDFRVHLHLFE